MTTRTKPVGNNLLVKLEKPKSEAGIVLPDGVQAPEQDLKSTVIEIGTNCTLGIKVGHEVVFKQNTQLFGLEDTDDYIIALIPEHAVLAIKNYSDEDSNDLRMDRQENPYAGNSGTPSSKVPNCS